LCIFYACYEAKCVISALTGWKHSWNTPESCT